MAKGKITKRSVDSIDVATGKAGAVRLWDSEIKGFGVRAYPSGRKVYVFKYVVDGRQGFVTIGDHGDPHTPDSARTAALELSFRVSRGEDPSAQKRALRPSVSVAELIDAYLGEGPISRPNKRASTWATETSRLNRHVRPLLGRRPANKITRQDVELMQSEIAAGKTALVERSGKPRGKAVVEGGRGVAANAVVCLSSMYSWAISKGIVQTNPCVGVQKYTRASRVRYFDKGEMGRLWHALDSLEHERSIRSQHADAIRVLALTGARKNEILALRWDEVHFDRRIIVLPSSRSKNGQHRTIHLSSPAIEILLRQLRSESPFVFSCATSKSGHVIGIPGTWRKVIARAAIENARLHDLRHNFASTAVGMNISLRLTGALLGHRSVQSTQVYAHVAADPAHEASEQVAARLLQTRTLHHVSS